MIIVRILEECLEHSYSAEELRSKMTDILALLKPGIPHDIRTRGTREERGR